MKSGCVEIKPPMNKYTVGTSVVFLAGDVQRIGAIQSLDLGKGVASQLIAYIIFADGMEFRVPPDDVKETANDYNRRRRLKA